MTTNRKMAGGSRKGTTSPKGWAKPPGFALMMLALLGLVQAGCQSSGCNNCSLTGIGSKISNGVQAVGAKVFRCFDHKNGGGVGCDACGGGVGGYEEGVVTESSGVPVAPGGMIMQGQGTMMPGSSVEPPSVLEAIPSSPGSGGAASTKGAGGNNKSAYETTNPRGGVARNGGSDLSRAVLSTPKNGKTQVEPNNLLDQIEPLDLPSDVTRKATSATPSSPKAPLPAPAAPTVPPTAENNSAAEGVLTLPPIEVAANYQAPGIRRSGSVAPSIGGGSAPSLVGLDWLKEKGYRTFVDLRQSSEIEANFADAVNDRGMVYISLPILASRLDSNRLARFSDLIGQSENRPLYFCDTDGTRAGLVWYLYLRITKQNDVQAATQEAEEIGLTAAQVKVAEAYLVAHPPKGKPIAQIEPLPEAPAPEQVAIAPSPVDSPSAALPESSAPVGISPQAPAAVDSPPVPMLPGEDRPQASSGSAAFFNDPESWKPVAALVLTSLGIPLAYLSRSAIGGVRTVKRASLTAGAPRPSKALPAGSDA